MSLSPQLSAGGDRPISPSEIISDPRREDTIRNADPDLPIPQMAGDSSQSISQNSTAPATTPVYSGDEARRVTTTSSDKPYSAFPHNMKWFIVWLVGIAAVCEWILEPSIGLHL